MMYRFGHILLSFFMMMIGITSVSAVGNEVYVDSRGVMRFSSDNKEASFYGVNYTLPFAHAYRAAGYLNKDRKESIDKDVYHISRLGVNAYRIHIWDVEISDNEGNLINNDHLDLLDYLINKLSENNIYTLITLQTNFGNGYPERDIMTGGYSYEYEKCDIHSSPKAIEAQKRYAQSVVSHVNRYNGRTYGSDPMIVGFEINNEPHHSSNVETTFNYINGMVAAIRSTGTKKPLFYNASHNMGHQSAYFAADIQGVTYQWYPTGLVSGSTRKGNYLPVVDSYVIPFDTLEGYNNKAKIVYEFDPADVLYSHLFPAIARTFRSEGFQWITQFAYDPVDLAWANTEYQTHYLNLLYTPAKAVSMKIAAQAAYSIPRNKKFPKYPNDTIFGDFTVSYNRDLSLMNSAEKFLYSGTNDEKPVNIKKLCEVTGCGSSRVVKYSGTGVYFLDKVSKGVWRLEVMPDVVYLDDPFSKTSLKKQVAAISNEERDMEINIPDLGESFTVEAVNKDGNKKVCVVKRAFKVFPGIYFLHADGNKAASAFPGKYALNENVVNEKCNLPDCAVNHKAPEVAERYKDLEISVTAVAAEGIDSIHLYSDKISFWKKENDFIRFKKGEAFLYNAKIPADWIKEDIFKYNIVVYSQGKCHTYPSKVEGHPLDWDFITNVFYEIPVEDKDSSIKLISGKDNRIEYYSIPDWEEEGIKEYITKYFIREKINSRKEKAVSSLRIKGMKDDEQIKLALITSDGYTYEGECRKYEDGSTGISLDGMKQVPTLVLPHAYPDFLEKMFTPEIIIPFDFNKVEYVQIHTCKPFRSSTTEVWFE